ncbi:Flp/Fap pilin component [compost metagenome]|jgi:pilus assembly protein Flp/PilA
MRNFIKNFANDESGATAIEYGLIAALMAVIIIAGIGLIGDQLSTKFSGIADAIGGAGAGAGGGEGGGEG